MSILTEVQEQMKAHAAVMAMARKAVVDALNADAGATPYAGFANDILSRMGQEPLVEHVVVTAEVPIEQDWRGEVEVEISDIGGELRQAIWDDQGDEGVERSDMEIDSGWGSAVSAEVNVNVTTTWRGEVEVEREDPNEALDDLVAGQVQLPGDWQVDSNRSIQVLRVVRKFA